MMRKDTEISNQFFSLDGYLVDFIADQWILSRDVSVDFSNLRSLTTAEAFASMKKVTRLLAKTKSAAHTASTLQRMVHYAKWHKEKYGLLSSFIATKIANYKVHVGKDKEHYVARVRIFLDLWHELGLPGLDTKLFDVISEWRLAGNAKGEAVALRDPHDGPFNDFEFEALEQGLTNNFHQGKISLNDFVIGRLGAFAGRRPLQLADLQNRDFVPSLYSEGEGEFVLNVPRRKQRGGAFREASKPVHLSKDHGALLARLIGENRSRFEDDELLVLSSNFMDFPIFPDWSKISEQSQRDIIAYETMRADFFHRASSDISGIIIEAFSLTGVISDRTNEPIHITPTRFRRTYGTRLAREGYGAQIIAECLDHSDTQNVQVYVENVPENIDAISDAVAGQLAPVAQAFSGKVVASEGDAIRGDDPTSRVRTDAGRVAGTCGNYGFCRSLAPVACYTCPDFQPWLHGPHEEMLAALQEKNEKIRRITGDPTIAAIANRTIIAIKQVIIKCKQKLSGELNA